MNDSDMGNSVVGNVEASRQKFKREKLAEKYAVGGKVKSHKSAVAGAAKRKLTRKYASGGAVQSPPVPASNPQSLSWWQRLQAEIKSLTQSAPLASTAVGNQVPSPPLPAGQAAMQVNQQAQGQGAASGPLGASK